MRAGIWLIGARGSVATTTIVGTLAVRAGLAEPTGCVTAHPALSAVPLPGFGDMVLGGHDAITSPVVKKAEQLAAAGVVPARLVGPLGADLAEVEAELRPVPAGATQAKVAAAITSDIMAFGPALCSPLNGVGVRKPHAEASFGLLNQKPTWKVLIGARPTAGSKPKIWSSKMVLIATSASPLSLASRSD